MSNPNPHSVCISDPEENRRIQERRKSYVSVREKARRFDEIVEQSQHYFAAFLAEHRIAINKQQAPSAGPDRRRYADDARRFASLAHEHWQALKLAGIAVVCPCHYCEFSSELIGESPERMAREQCQKTGESNA